MTLISRLCVIQLLRDMEHCSPDYIVEKFELLKDEQYAFAMLDSKNQIAVLDYLKEWNQRIPEWMKKWMRELEAIR